MARKVCLYFQVHQPERLSRYGVFDIGRHNNYFDHSKNEAIMRKVAAKCYIPANTVLKGLAAKHSSFKAAFSVTGTALEQFQKFHPEVLESFKALASTGKVEFLAETYYHSLSFLFSKEEFKEQVLKHERAVKELFDQEPRVFRNTELIYSNEVAKAAEELGYQAVLAEGAEHVLGWRSPNYVYKAKGAGVKLLMKNYKLSDDVAFRFSDKEWAEHPLTPGKFVSWLKATPGDTINLFMDYETFGEHHWEDTGILRFLEGFIEEIIKSEELELATPSEVAALEAMDEVDVPFFTSWADTERDLSAWSGNSLQRNALQELYNLERAVKESGSEELLEAWRKLTTSDHFYYMCIKWFNDGDVHKYFNPYESPYEAYIAFMNVLNDLALRLKQDRDQGMIITENPSRII